MVVPRRTKRIAVVALCCLALFALAPVATGAQQSATDAPIAADSAGQSVSTCFSGAGHAFTIGSADGTHIWVRLHAAALTDSGGSVGAELVGSTGGTSIVEVIAGFEYVGDGLLDLLSSPADAFEIVHGFDFQLPMLDIAPGIGNENPSNDSSAAANRSSEADGDREPSADDGPFEMLRC